MECVGETADAVGAGEIIMLSQNFLRKSLFLKTSGLRSIFSILFYYITFSLLR